MKSIPQNFFESFWGILLLPRNFNCPVITSLDPNDGTNIDNINNGYININSEYKVTFN